MIEPINADVLVQRARDTRGIIIDDYFARGELMMMFAPSGVGKTFNALNMGISMACGGKFYGDNVIGDYRVLYVDGELGIDPIGMRLAELLKARNISSCSNLSLLSPDMLKAKAFPSLSLESTQEFFDCHIKRYGINVVILDNYNTLVDDGGNMFFAWSQVSKWLNKLKNSQISVVLIHHTNKQNNDPAGTVKMEQQMDCVIKFSNSPLAEEGEKLIEMEWKKTRWTRTPSKKLLNLVEHSDGSKALRLLNYKAVASERILEMYEKRGLSYVSNRVKIPIWQIRDICNITSKDAIKEDKKDFTPDMSKLGNFL